MLEAYKAQKSVKEETDITRQEVSERVLAKVPEEKKEVFIEEIVGCRNKAEKMAVLKKYGIQLTAEEFDAISSSEMTDEGLDVAAGGCCNSCSGDCAICGPGEYKE